MAVMVPLIISHDGAVHRATVMRWKDFAPDIQVDWERMAQSVLRFNVVIVGRFFNKGSWVSEAWRREHPEEFTDETCGPPERMPSTEESKRAPESCPCSDERCVRSSDTPPPRGARLTSAERANLAF